MSYNKNLPASEITEKVTRKTVEFAEDFGKHLGTTESFTNERGKKVYHYKLTTSQLRKFFGEVKRQQMEGYNETEFVLLKPKLAYAVGRDTNHTKIDDFYKVMSNLMDLVKDEKTFQNFIYVFEAIVAYHKASEENRSINA